MDAREISLAITLGGALLSPGSAQAASEPVRVVYAAEGDCPDQRAFLEQLYSRAKSIRPAVESEQAWLVRVAVRGEQGAASGTIVVDDVQGISTTRQMEGATCTDVVAGLALIAALAIDPFADTTQCGSPATNPPPTQRRKRATRFVSPAIENDQGVDPPQRVEQTRDRAWKAGVEVFGLSGVAPALRPGTSLVLGYDPLTAPAVAPRFNLAISYLPKATFETQVGGVELSWVGVRAEVCPVAGSSDLLRLLACATTGLGQLSAHGTGTGQSEKRTWVDVGLAAHGQWLLADWLSVDVHGSALAPLTRYTIVFDNPAVQVHDTPVLAAELGAGIAVRFP